MTSSVVSKGYGGGLGLHMRPGLIGSFVIWGKIMKGRRAKRPAFQSSCCYRQQKAGTPDGQPTTKLR